MEFATAPRSRQRAFERRQPELECVRDLFGVGCGQTALGADRPMRPSCGLLGRANLIALADKVVAQGRRGLNVKDRRGGG
jgi:hypothetical protein